MARRSGTRSEYLRITQHERDRNVPGLIGDQDSGDEVIRAHAARALVDLGAKDAAPSIAKLAEDPVDAVRMAAYMRLGELRARDFTALLVSGLNDPVPVVRMGAAHGLWDMRDSSAIPGLREALSTEQDRAVRFRLAYALVTLRDKEVLKDLPRVLREQRWRVRHFSPKWKELKQAADSQELPPTY
jgi:HEAT repeat protein